MDTIGLDLHKRESQLCVIADDGRVTEQRIATTRERFGAVVGGRPPARILLARMHRTLKRRAVKPVQRTSAGQQRQFDAFRVEYNTERPHEALQLETPASRYPSSPRPFPNRPPTLEYPGHFLVKRVTDAGTFRFQQRLLYIANALVERDFVIRG
jgi:hypothetical protein